MLYEIPKSKSESDTTKDKLKTREGLAQPGGVSPVPLCGMRREADARTEAGLGREQSLPNKQRAVFILLERLNSSHLSRSKKQNARYLGMALVALAEMPEADAEGAPL